MPFTRKLALGASILGVLFALPASAAKLLITPGSGAYPPEEVIGFEIRLDNEGECVNAAQVDLSYPRDLLEAVEVSQGDSIFSVWVTPPTIRKEYGLISLVGGVPGGYCGRTPGDPSLTNVLAKVFFKAPSLEAYNGEAIPLRFMTSSRVVLNDGQGTEAKLSTKGAEIRISQKAPKQGNEWQKILDEDKIPPEDFHIEIHKDPNVLGGAFFAVFGTNDKQSGIDRYEILELKGANSETSIPEGAQFRKEESPYVLEDQRLRSLIIVRAFDKAGNVREAKYLPSEDERPKERSYFLWIVIGSAAALLALLRFVRIIPWI